METKNKKQKIPAATEEHAVILDYLSLGYVNSDMSKFKGKAISLYQNQFLKEELIQKFRTLYILEKEKETKYIKFLENQTMKT